MLARRTAPLLAALLVAPLSLVAAPVATASDGPAPAPTQAASDGAAESTPAEVSAVAVPALPRSEQRAVDVPQSADPVRTLAAVAPRATRDYGLLGVTWDRGTGHRGMRVQVRTRADGSWTRWSDLEIDRSGGARAGTEPMWVGEADGVAVRVLAGSGRAPSHVRTVLVDPGTTASTASATPAARVAAAAAPSARAASAPAASRHPSYTPRPRIISRAAWGARPNSSCDSPRYGSTQLGIVFHHTAGSNRYTRAQSAGIVRSVQAYHMSGRGWCDIGYNFLVDKYGQIFEGRSGGTWNQVRGAHAGNATVNTYTTGVSMMGNLDTTRPTPAMRYAATRLIGWRLATFYVPARGRYSIAGHSLPRIAGHGDVYRAGIRPGTSTACPGRYGLSFLRARHGLRSSVASYISGYRTAIRTRAAQLGRARTGNVYVGEHPVASGFQTVFTRGEISYRPGYGARWTPNGPVRSRYDALGGPSGRLGFPRSDVVASGTQTVQTYVGGTISHDSATGLTSVTYR